MAHRYLTAGMAASYEFEQGQRLGREQERERLSVYFHCQLAPDLTALAFSIESVRAELESENHEAALRLKEVLDSLTEMIEPIREEILKFTALDQN
ncbi:MAG TPA: hypothetical protein VN939_10785 [Chthoniobacterales bacterium]|nr:hypothetical protein [Chthoniobacterales bacterium]